MILALVSAAIVAGVAYRVRLLSMSGALAATVVGAAAVGAGIEWVVILLFFFATANALSVWRGAERERITGSLVQKGGRRDAAQVLANGAVFAAAALLATVDEMHAWSAVGVGALAAAMADTWSTEIGTVLGGPPRLILGGRAVPPGTSGGVTIVGTGAGIVGAILAAVAAVVMDWNVPVAAIVAGGIAGLFVDSLVGATIQERRWCETCSLATEQPVHTCGTTTTHRGGLRGCNNDVVNFISTLAGGAVTWAFT